MNRLSKEEYGCYLALTTRSRSEDPHTQVGAVLFDENWRVVSTGFNGFAPGKTVDDSIFLDRDKKNCLMNHAEINAILHASKEAKYACMVYSPCIHCAKTIGASRIKKIWFLKQYIKHGSDCPDTKYQEIFDFNNIEYFHLKKENLKNILSWHKKNNEFLLSLSND